MNSMGRNKILPVETIESEIPCDSKIRNRINETEKPLKMAPIGQQISKTTDSKMDCIHYISFLFAIPLTCVALYGLIVPWHNVLREPFYWYEGYAYFVPPWLAICVAHSIMALEYWAGIKYDKKMNQFFFLIGTSGVFYAVIALFYYFIHVYYFELFAPLPHGAAIPGTLLIHFLVPQLFFRYHNTSHTGCQSGICPLIK